MVATVHVRSHRSLSRVRQTQVNANDLHDSSPSMQLTAHGNPRREGAVHTIVAR
jgi:hypothetical protein